jgi:(5-formylfuran-3-yl)methyl phosphate synthase
VNKQEAIAAIEGGADIIDAKNPKEGPLGATMPWITKKIRESTPKEVEVSCTLGDLPNLPGSAALAALGAASTGVNYIKASLYGVKTQKDAINFLKCIVQAAKELNPSIKIAATGFADAERVYSVNPILIPTITKEANADIAMLDTAIKDGKNLLNFLNTKQLETFVNKTHALGLTAALAGSLRKEDINSLTSLTVDIIGVRGAACTNEDRANGHVTTEKVKQLANIVKTAPFRIQSSVS